MDFLSGGMQLMVQRLIQSSGMCASGASFTYNACLHLCSYLPFEGSVMWTYLFICKVLMAIHFNCEWTVSTQLSPACVQKIQFIWVSVDDQNQSILPLPSNIKKTFAWNTLCGRIWMRVEKLCSFKTRKKELSSLRSEVKETRRNAELQNAWSCN